MTILPPSSFAPCTAEASASTRSAGQGPTLSDAAFDCIAKIAHREAGLYLAPGKSAMVRTRLARRLRALQLTSFEAYCEVVKNPAEKEELGIMISALTTNVSHFFREEHHFDLLRETVIPTLMAKSKSGQRIRIWSAGCSNGQEPYSIAMTLIEEGFPGNADLKILATDIDPNVVAHAKAGAYPEQMMSGLSPDRRERFFEKHSDRNGDVWRADTTLREWVSFRQLNLLHDWPMRGAFDAIFCRNVVIYFDQPTQDRLWQRFAGILNPDGWMFLGHSERVSEASLHLFANKGVTSYRRTHAPSGPLVPTTS